MAQLLVRDIEPAVVKKLRGRAAAHGISVAEAHRRLLREALVGDRQVPQANFIEYLRGIPPGGAIEFRRATDLPRRNAL